MVFHLMKLIKKDGSGDIKNINKMIINTLKEYFDSPSYQGFIDNCIKKGIVKYEYKIVKQYRFIPLFSNFIIKRRTSSIYPYPHALDKRWKILFNCNDKVTKNNVDEFNKCLGSNNIEDVKFIMNLIM